MKILTTAILILSLTVVTFADKPDNFNAGKEKRINKVSQRIIKIENRKQCMQNATSLNGLQACRVEKNRNKPFKLKKGMTFEAKKTKIVNRISNRLSKITQLKSCIQNALNSTDLKACKPKKKSK